MPELPEVETVARGLERAIVGDAVASVEVLRTDSIAFPDVDQFCELLVGHSIESVTRRGKYVVANLSDGARLVVHLRMSGRLVVKRARAQADRFLRVRIKLKSKRELHFEDMRVFGRIWYVAPDLALNMVVSGLESLGVEPLTDLQPRYLKDKFSGKRQAIKSALLDQSIIAGIGNIYADECLFLSGIHPMLPAGDLKLAQLETLVANIIKVLENAISLGGSTLRDYRDAQGENGNYQGEAWVYGREGEQCRRCSDVIMRVKLSGRSSHFCPRCQSNSRRKGK